MWKAVYNYCLSPEPLAKRCFKNRQSDTFCNRTVTDSNRLLCLEMVYLLWLSPHPGFHWPSHCSSAFHCLGAPAVFLAWSWCGWRCVLEGPQERTAGARSEYTGPPPAVERSKVPSKTVNCQNLSPGPEGLPALAAYCVPSGDELHCWRVADSEWPEGSPQRPVTMALRLWWHSICEKNQCHGYRLPSRLLGHLVLVYSESHTRLWLAL